MFKTIIYISFLTMFMNSYGSLNPRILELNSRFLEIRKNENWLVMFYVPWCAHCKRLEPTWSHVQQALHQSGIRICKLDCTVHKNVCNYFRIKMYPTVMFIRGDEAEITYTGDRVTNDIVHFALRLANPPVRKLDDNESIDHLKKENIIFFTYLGEPNGELWESYVDIAIKFQPHSYFYHAFPSIANKYFKEYKMPTVICHKESNLYAFNENKENEYFNKSLYSWINEERFPTFVKINRLTMNSLLETNKYIVIVVVEENKIKDIPVNMMEFKNMVESVIRNYRDRFYNHFQFAWTGTPDLAHSIMMMKVPLPYLLVLNSTTSHYHVPDDDPSQLTPEAIILFLDSIQNQTAKTYGGNNILITIYRLYFEAVTKLSDMWKGNPILTCLMFGLPSVFFSLICYSIFCSDILDSNDDDDDYFDEEIIHEKKE